MDTIGDCFAWFGCIRDWKSRSTLVGKDDTRRDEIYLCRTKYKQDCFLQKEARVCVSNAFVIEDSQFKWCFFVVEYEQVTEEADMLMWI